VAICFEDLPPEEKIEFLDKSRQLYPAVNPLGPDFESTAPSAALPWGCRSCTSRFSIETVLVAKGEPQCPNCDAVGWATVRPVGSH
jgi:hypothetical protein